MLKFIGLGLHDEYGISLRGLREAQASDHIFAEFYTNIMPGLDLSNLKKLVGREVTVLSRRDLEEDEGEIVLKAAGKGDASLLVPGDPMNATTHIDLKVRAEGEGVETMVIHAASITSAIAGVTGLQNYKFGRTVTIPLLGDEPPPTSPYDYIKGNLDCGLHTLVLLDLRVEEKEYLKVGEALQILLKLEERRREKVIDKDGVIICAARIGGPDAAVRIGRVSDLLDADFGSPPYSLVIPGDLHFVEKKALSLLNKV